MRRRTVILVAAVTLLLVGSGSLAQLGRSGTIEEGVVSGGQYRLTRLMPPSVPDPIWQVRGTASGGHYRLAAAPALGSAGSGCCCTYLPCILRSYRP